MLGTFNIDDVLSQLLLKIKINNIINQIVDSVYIRMNTLESLDLFANEKTVRDLLLQVDFRRGVIKI